jgi:hypothetical protein
MLYCYALLLLTFVNLYKELRVFVSLWFKTYAFARSRAPCGSKNGVGVTTAGI